MAIVRRSEAEIREQIALFEAPYGEGQVKYSGSAYAQGVVAALTWVLGEEMCTPMEQVKVREEEDE